jgi:penicillin amidase
MKIIKRTVYTILALLIVILVAAFFFIRHLSHRSIPDYNKDLPIAGLHAPVEVYRDSLAIPHVYATDEHDLYMATGYLLAEDRLWQMDMLRHVSEGRLSEIFGKDYVDTDLLLRALRFREKSEMILLQSDPASLDALNAFASGVNQYIQNNSRRLPPEFAILNYKPGKWEPYHSLNMIGYMAWDLKAGWSEILLSTIQGRVDSMRYMQLLPDLLRKQPAVFSVPDEVNGSVSLLPDLLLNTARLQHLGADVLDASNNWAVSGSRSSTGMPLLANDMHLSLSVPGIWYQMHQVVEGRLNVTGLVLPGAPVIICGHNDSIAWGMTNTYVDNMDFYEEKINPGDSSQYEYMGEWRNFEIQNTVIKTSDGEEIEKTIWFSHRGPVVSSFKKIAGKAISMHWVGDEASNEFLTIMLLNRAANWNDFTSALRTFTSISQNIVYADKRGNIGLFCAAGVPVRNRDIPFGILPGDTDKYDWKGYVPFEELPYLFNPPSGIVASANNRTAPTGYPYHIGSWYSLPSRYERIIELLSAKELHTVIDFAAIQLDQHSKLAEKYLPFILDALSGYSNMSPLETRAGELLKNWDCSMNSKSAAALLFESIYLAIIKCTFGDELGEDLFGNFNGVSSLSRIATDQLIDAGSSAWFDNVNTRNKTEDLYEMIICAFSSTVSELETSHGGNPDTWEWGARHNLLLSHPLSAVKILDRVFGLNRGPFPVGGSFHTVSPFSYGPNKPFSANHGASHRHIFDLSNWDNSLTLIPTGNSGIPASRHYCDQTEMYVQGKYHPDHFSKEKVVANTAYHRKFVTMQ